MSASTEGKLITDMEREATTRELDRAFGTGALTDAEHDERVDRALRSRRPDELAALVRDLPEPVPTPAERRRADLREWGVEWRWWLAGALVMSAIWGADALLDEPGRFWPVVPLAIWAAVLIAVALLPDDEADR